MLLIKIAMLSVVFETANGPGGGGGGFKNPHDLENNCNNLHHIIDVHFTRCFTHVPVIYFFRKLAIITILQRFQNKK